MGVSLERVQNKFACIIGELCNEPVVLSQFAIWVDMRLAEYKAKGSICLECCGDIPKPTWLKGLPLKDTDPEMLPVDEGWPPGMILDSTGQSNYSDEGLGAIIDHDGHSRRRPARPSNRQFHPASRRSDNGTPSSSHPNSPRTNLHADLPSDILIKQEAHDPSDNIQISSHSSDWRKRPSDTDYGSNISLQVKSQKLSSDVTPLNEPLSAIINRAELAESQSNSAIDKLSAMTEQSFNQSINTDDDDDIQVEIISGPSSILPASSNIIPYPGTSSADFSSHSAANNSELDSSRLSQNDSLMDSELANTSGSVQQDFGCTICGMTFTQICSLNRHVKFQHSELWFSCDDCGRRFKRKDTLKRHRRSCHNSTRSDEIKDSSLLDIVSKN